MSDKNTHLVILAGGVGSRFWPLSSEEKPKQFLDILRCGKTLLQLTAERFANLVPKENIWVLTSARYVDFVYEQLPDIAREQVLAEPCGRNTAHPICYISWKIKKRNPRANVMVTPADHFIPDTKAFEEVMEECLSFAAETDALVTLGVKPTRPETGYGYIKADLGFASSRGHRIFRVDGFTEKPDLATAESYVQLPNYLWNSGIFVWSVSTIVNAFRVYEPTISAIFENLLPVYDTPEEQACIDRDFPKCESISVDYAIMEKAEEIFVHPVTFAWSDLGTWTALRNEVSRDEHDNAAIGENIHFFDSDHCIVHVEGKKRVVVQGLDGYVVVEKDDEILICKLSEEQRIKLFH